MRRQCPLNPLAQIVDPMPMHPGMSRGTNKLVAQRSFTICQCVGETSSTTLEIPRVFEESEVAQHAGTITLYDTPCKTWGDIESLSEVRSLDAKSFRIASAEGAQIPSATPSVALPSEAPVVSQMPLFAPAANRSRVQRRHREEIENQRARDHSRKRK